MKKLLLLIPILFLFAGCGETGNQTTGEEREAKIREVIEKTKEYNKDNGLNIGCINSRGLCSLAYSYNFYYDFYPSESSVKNTVESFVKDIDEYVYGVGYWIEAGKFDVRKKGVDAFEVKMHCNVSKDREVTCKKK